jgi:hypothetical protein
MRLELASSRTSSAGQADHEVSSTTVASALDDQSARVAVSDVLFEGRLDGAWWPRSRDVTTQLPRLLLALPDRLGRITRVSLNLTMWDGTPNRVHTPGSVLKRGRVHGHRSKPDDTLGRRGPPDTPDGNTAGNGAGRRGTRAHHGQCESGFPNTGQLLATAAGKRCRPRRRARRRGRMAVVIETVDGNPIDSGLFPVFP